MKNHQHINADSGSDEYFTPGNIIECARLVLGRIDLDPASSLEANATVQADRFFTIADDGLHQEWGGRIWMNHPFGRKTNKPWVDKLVSEYRAGRVTEAVCITFAATSEQWFRPLLYEVQCYLHGRTNYYLPDGTLKRGVTKGSVLTYFGPAPCLFAEAFRKTGTVKSPWSYAGGRP